MSRLEELNDREIEAAEKPGETQKVANEWESAEEKRKRLPTSLPVGGIITPV